MEGVIGEIRLFAGNFAPRNWAYCNGALIAISQNTALFSILGTTYGGNGTTNFGLPDLRGRAPVSSGTGPGLSTRALGSRSGAEEETVTELQLAAHFHSGNVIVRDISSQEFLIADSSDETFPEYNYFADAGLGKQFYGTVKDDSKTMNDNMLMAVASSKITAGLTGGGQFHNNMQPFLVLSYIICLTGVFPSRS
ncbi:MAG: tail fiber protein [Cytophagales bacterium]|nr:tail fiber protein [Cytophagales bacterium]